MHLPGTHGRKASGFFGGGRGQQGRRMGNGAQIKSTLNMKKS